MDKLNANGGTYREPAEMPEENEPMNDNERDVAKTDSGNRAVIRVVAAICSAIVGGFAINCAATIVTSREVTKQEMIRSETSSSEASKAMFQSLNRTCPK